MYSTVDTRVVELKFDNAEFEKNVQSSLESLDRLNKSLELDNSTKGAKDLVNAYTGSGNSITSAISTVSTKFSALEIAGKRAIENIVDFGMAKISGVMRKFVVAPISQGFTKYGEKNTAIRTTMNSIKDRYESEEAAMESISNVVSKLMWYSDETSYSFNEMLTNMSKFTSAGGDLEKSANVMIGISNAAALAGQNSQSAARVMYNMAQAYGAGSVKLIDWKSVELANVGTEKLKNTIIDAAVALGTLERDAKGVAKIGNEIVTASNFGTTLAKGWFTSSVMEEAFGTYSNFANELYEVIDETGETATSVLQTITKIQNGVGNADDIELVNRIIEDLGITATESSSAVDILANSIGTLSFKSAQEARTFADAMDAINDVVSTGWMEVYEAIFGDVDESAKIWTTFANEVSTALYEIPGAISEILVKWRELGGATSLFNTISNVWNGLISIVEAIRQAFSDVFGTTEDFGESLSTITKKIEKLTYFLKPTSEVLEILKAVLKGIFTVIKLIIGAARLAMEMVVPAVVYVATYLDNALSGLYTLPGKISASVKKAWTILSGFIKGAGSKASNILTKLKSGFAGVLNRIWNSVKVGLSEISKHFKSFGFTTERLVELASKVKTRFQNVIGNIVNLFKTFPEKALSFFKDFPNRMGSIFSRSLPIIKNVFDKLKITVENFATSFRTVFGGSKGAISGSFSDAEATATKSSSSLLDTLKKRLEKIKQSISGTNGEGPLSAIIGFLKKIRELIDLVKGILQDLHIIKKDDKEIGSFKDLATNIGKTFDSISDFFEAKTKSVKANNFLKYVAGFFIIVASVKKLKEVISEFGAMETNSLIKGIIGVAGVLATMSLLVVAINKLNEKVGGIKIPIGLFVSFTSMATAMSKMVGAIDSLGKLNLKQIGTTILGIAGLLASMSGAMILASRFSKTQAGVTVLPTAFTSLATAVANLADPFIKLSSISIEGIKQGVLAMTAILAAVSATIIITSRLAKTQLGVTVIPQSFESLGKSVASIAPVFIQLSALSLKDIAMGSAALLAILASMSAALLFAGKVIGASLGTVVIPQSFEAMAKSVVSIVPSFTQLANLRPAEIARGGASLVLILGTMSGAATLLSKFSGFSLSFLMLPQVFDSMTKAITGVASVFETLGKMSIGEILKASLALVLILGSISAALIVVRKFAGGLLGISIGNVGKAFVPLAESVQIIAEPFISLSKLSLGDILAGLAALTTIMSVLSGTIILDTIAFTFISANKIDKIGKAYKTLVEVVKDITDPLIAIANVKKETIDDALSSIKLIFGNFADAFKDLGGIKNIFIGGNKIEAIGQGFMSCAKAISEVAPSFVEIGKLKSEQVSNGAKAIEKIIEPISDALKKLSSSTFFGIGLKGIGDSFFKMSETIVNVQKSFASLGKLSTKSIDAASASLNKILDAMSVALSKEVKGNNALFKVGVKNAESYKALAEAISTIADPFTKLSRMNDKTIKSGSENLNNILSAMAKGLGSGKLKNLTVLDKGYKDIGEGYYQMAMAIKDIYQPFSSLSKLSDSQIDSGSKAITSILESMAKASKITLRSSGTLFFGKKLSAVGTAYTNFAEAISDITEPFKTLGNLSPKTATSASKTVNDILVGISEAIVSTAKGTSWRLPKKVTAIGGTYKDIADSLNGISSSFVSLSKLKQYQVEVACSAISTILDSIGSNIINTSNNGSGFGKMESAASSYVTVANAVKDISTPFNTLAKLSPDKVENGVKAVNGVLSGISSAIVNTSKNTGGFLSPDIGDIGSSYLSFATAIKDIAGPFSTLSKLRDNQVESGTKALTTILSGISDAIVNTSNGLNKWNITNPESIGKTYSDMATSVKDIAGPFATLSKLRDTQVENGVESMTKILEAISSTVIKLGNSTYADESITDVSQAFKDVSGIFADLVKPFTTLSKFKQTDIDKGTYAIKSILDTISGVLVESSNKLDSSSSTVTIKQMGDSIKDATDALEPITKAISTLSGIKASESKIEKASDAITTVIKALGSILSSDTGFFSLVFSGKTTESFNGLTSALEPIADAISIVSGIDTSPEKIESAGKSISAVITSLGEVFSKNGLFSSLFSGQIAKNFPKLVEQLKPIAEAIRSLASENIPAENAIAAGESIAYVVESLGDVLNENSKFGSMLRGNLLESVGVAFADMAGSLSGISESVNSIASFGVDDKTLEDAKTAITDIVNSIGGVIVDNNKFGVLLRGNFIKSLGISFSTMSTGVKDIGSAIKDLSSGTVTKDNLNRATKSINSIIGTLSGILTSGELNEFGMSTRFLSFERLGGAFKDMSDGVSGISDAIIKIAGSGLSDEKISRASSILITIINKFGGILEDVNNFGSSTRWASYLSLGQGFKTMSEGLGNISDSVTKLSSFSGNPDRVNQATTSIIDIINSFGGVIEDVSHFGSSTRWASYLSIGQGFKTMSEGLGNISDSVDKISSFSGDPDRVNQATTSIIDIINSFGSILDDVNNPGSSLRWASYLSIGQGFKTMSEGLGNISDSVDKISSFSGDSERVDQATDSIIDIINSFGSILDDVNSPGSSLRWASYLSLGQAFKTMSEGLGNISDSITKIAEEKIDEKFTTAAAENIKTVINGLGGILDEGTRKGGVFRWTQFVALGNSFVNMTTGLGGIKDAIISVAEFELENEKGHYTDTIPNAVDHIVEIINALGDVLDVGTKKGGPFRWSQFESLGKAFANMTAGLGGISDSIGTVASLNKDTLDITNAAVNIRYIIDGLGNILAEAGDDGRLKFDNFTRVGDAFKTMTDGLNGISSAIADVASIDKKDSKQRATNAAENIKIIIDSLGSILLSAADKQSTVSTKETLTSLGNAFKTMSDGLSGISSAILDLTDDDKYDAEKVTNAAENLSMIISSIGGVFDVANETATDKDAAESFRGVGDAFSTMAGSLTGISNAINLIANKNNLSGKKIDQAVGSLKTIIKSISGIFEVTDEAAEDKHAAESFRGVGDAFSAMAGSLQSISQAIIDLASGKGENGIDDARIEEATASLTNIINSITGIFAATEEAAGDRHTKDSFLAVADSFTTMTLALDNIGASIIKIAEFATNGDKTEAVSNASAALSSIVSSIASVFDASTDQKSNKYSKETFLQVADSFDKITVSMANIEDSVEDLASATNLTPEKMESAGKGIAVVVDGIADVFYAATNKNRKYTGDQLIKAADAFGTIASSLKYLSDSVKDLGQTDFLEENDIGTVTSNLTTLMTEISKVINDNSGIFKDVEGSANAFNTVASSLSYLTDAISFLSNATIDGTAFTTNKGYLQQLFNLISDNMDKNSKFMKCVLGFPDNFAETFTALVGGLPNLCKALETDLGPAVSSLEGAPFDTVGAGLSAVVTPLGQLGNLMADGNSTKSATNISAIGESIRKMGNSLPRLQECIDKMSKEDGSIDTNGGVIGYIKELGNTVNELSTSNFSAVSGYMLSLDSSVSALASLGKGELGSGFKTFIGYLNEFKTAINGLAGAEQVFNGNGGGYEDIVAQGEDYCSAIAEGIRNKQHEVSSASGEVARKAKNEAGKYRGYTSTDGTFYGVGANLMAGLKEGIKDHAQSVIDAVAKVCKDSIHAGKKELDINSPSKVFASMGRSVDEGLVNGLKDNSGNVTSTVKNLCDSAIEAASALEQEFDDGVTIKPVVDLSDVQRSSEKIAGLLNRKEAIAVNSTVSASKVESDKEPREIQNTPTNQQAQPSYSFVQNNYSPKALSRADIYRQTKNQFSMMKGLVSNV